MRGAAIALEEAAEGGRIKLDVEEESPFVRDPAVLLADPFDDDESTRCRGAPAAGNRRTAGNPFGREAFPPSELVDDDDESEVESSGRDRGGGSVDVVGFDVVEDMVADIDRLKAGLLPPNALDEFCDDARPDFETGGFDVVGTVGRLKEVEEGNREVEANLASPGRASLLLNPALGLSTVVELVEATVDEGADLIDARITVGEFLADASSSVVGLFFGTSFAPSCRPLDAVSRFATSPLLLFSPRFRVDTAGARLDVRVLSCRRAVGAASAGACCFLRFKDVATGVEEEALGVLSTIVAVEEAEMTTSGAWDGPGVEGD